jgi:hypothetical protein
MKHPRQFCIFYNINIGFGYAFSTKLYQKELKYRIKNKIKIKD